MTFQEGDMSQFNIAVARAHFSELVHKALMGESVIIARANKPILKLVPVKSSGKMRQPGLAKGKVLFMSPDFDEPLAEFAKHR
jgi:prevent-host-death family protein